MSTQYLFNRTTFRNFAAEIMGNADGKINSLRASAFNNKNVIELSDEIYDTSKIAPIDLQVKNVYQKAPKDVGIKITSRFRGGESTVPGTIFEMIVPYSGNKVLFDVQPNKFSSNIPVGSVQSDGLHFIFEVRAFSNIETIMPEYLRNIENIENWLGYLEEDIISLNNLLKNKIQLAIEIKKGKLDNDAKAAASFGIPIR